MYMLVPEWKVTVDHYKEQCNQHKKIFFYKASAPVVRVEMKK